MTTTPFLGCKISLISKSEIRYEGILYTIDPKESTIALSKVRSYGTEDRMAERQVPPRDEIFEYIIFRAGDIKDLIVDDPPASIAPGLADPAIIQAHSTSTSGATFPSTTFAQMSPNTNISATPGHRSTAPAFSSGQNAINSLTMGTAFKSNASNDSRSQNSTPTGSQPQQRTHSPHTDQPSAQSIAAKQPIIKENQRKNTSERGQPPHQYRRDGGGRGGGQGQQPFQQNYNYAHNRRGSGQQPQQNNYRQQHHQNHSQPNQSNRFSGYNRPFNNYSGGGGGGGGGPRRPPMHYRPQSQRGSQNRNPNQNRLPKEPLKFDKEFDFDKGLEEFSELEKQLTHLKLDGNVSDGQSKEEDKHLEANSLANDGSTNGEKDDEHYDKTKSFFDTISCEALEREKGNVQRIDWKAERKLNSETFGVSLSYRRMGYRGRGGYGYRGYNTGFNRNRGGGGFNRGGGGGDTRRYKGPQQQQQPLHNRNN